MLKLAFETGKPTTMDKHHLLKQYFGYDEFRPGQEAVIDHVLSGRDGLVIMPTGGGKSLCFQLPALMFEGVTLVVSPLISLMKDQVDALNAAGVSAAFINSTLTPIQIAQTQQAVLARKIKILYVAPERFAVSSFGNFLSEIQVSLLAVDEAHCISEWGHDFRPDYRNLRSVRQQLKDVPVLALTATATEQVRRDIAQQLELSGGRIFISSFDRPNLSYSVWPKKKSFPKIVGLLRAYENESAIIYCSSRKNTESIAGQLQARGIAAMAYHAGLENSERHRVQELFIRSEIQVVVATIAFGMGIDKPDVRLVIHYDMPKTIEGYYQETGRAGRDGLPSRCVFFYTFGDRQKQMFLINQLDDANERRKAIEKLNWVNKYGKHNQCRRKFLLEYFGEGYAKANCGACDVCEPELRVAEAVEIKTGRRTVKNSDPILFEKLRRLRKEIADSKNVPAFVIFGDQTLLELSARRPQSLEEMSGIFGIGEKKLAELGNKFLTVIQEHVPEPELLKEPRPSTVDETLRLWNEGLTIDEIAEARERVRSTIISHLEQAVQDGEKIDLTRESYSLERLEIIRVAFKQKGFEKLGPIKGLLGDDYDWDELRFARLLLQAEAVRMGEKVA